MAVLSKLTLSSTNDHGPDIDSRLKKWIENNGGKYVSRITKGVTHLICSKTAWKKQSEAVTAAQKYGTYIINYDWLEDSLQKKRKLTEKKYLWDTVERERRRKKEMVRMGRKVDAAKFEKGCEEARTDTGSGKSKSSLSVSFFRSAFVELAERRERREAEAKACSKAEKKAIASAQTQAQATAQQEASPPMDSKSSQSFQSSQRPTSKSTSTPTLLPLPTPTSSLSLKPPTSSNAQANPATLKLKDLYHLYHDTTGFSYNILLIRANLLKNQSERYNIRLYESHTVPHVYCTVVQYAPARGEWSSADSGTSNVSEKHARLISLVSSAEPTTPTPTIQPFKTILTPLSSPFQPAFSTFRHAFQDLTLLSWEQRLHPSFRALQKSLAKSYNVEPFLYAKPSAGLPVGLTHQLPHQGYEDGYVRGELRLPGMEVPLTKAGTFGCALVKEMEEMEKLEEEKRIRLKREEDERNGLSKKSRNLPATNWNRPFFNSVGGRPDTLDMMKTGGNGAGNAGECRGVGPSARKSGAAAQGGYVVGRGLLRLKQRQKKRWPGYFDY
ncbi:uncharacterized protein BDR25DRAFT_226538 [Lindgomyces ingoldianus]|uniref:Uncharacterized protein n=1 Tax=Lindgomyces ingoldianus TaxID=673940 RepID=A0ACB6QTC3_9PLEO|nr:uncharacterized protein BDR25DRAFT_226538 [Lindgomyces ingoldianus]KAF2470191.1 hypothetical protein BDR25DRAFT_226538 [Lindgomyces ingoldianus]